MHTIFPTKQKRTSTPWGVSNWSLSIDRGLSFHSTPSHGGYLVGKGYAKKHLSAEALKCGFPWGNYICFEEDCAAEYLENEIPHARTARKNGRFI